MCKKTGANDVHPTGKIVDKVMKKPREMISEVVAEDTDPNGSYTGAPVNRNEKPVQDADDL
jgi:hypothetical protein